MAPSKKAIRDPSVSCQSLFLFPNTLKNSLTDICLLKSNQPDVLPARDSRQSLTILQHRRALNSIFHQRFSLVLGLSFPLIQYINLKLVASTNYSHLKSARADFLYCKH